MTTSGTTAYAPNRAQVIQDALEMCGSDVYGENDPAVFASAGRSLNTLIKALNANKTDVNVIVRTTFDTVAGTGSYATDALGVDGMTVNAAGGDSVVSPITKQQYDAKVDKTAQGRPSHFYHDKQAGLIYLHPVPDAVYEVVYGKVRQYQDIDEPEQTFDFPSSAIEMLTFGLAHRYGFKSGMDAGTRQDLERQFIIAEKKYLVANSAYTKGQRATSCMVV